MFTFPDFMERIESGDGGWTSLVSAGRLLGGTSQPEHSLT